MAAALALLTDKTVQHGPLELIFTVEEETGLYGARSLDALMVRARTLINLDTEEPNKLMAGCADRATAVVRLPILMEKVMPKSIGVLLTVNGLRGGHSGLQIHEFASFAYRPSPRRLVPPGRKEGGRRA